MATMDNDSSCFPCSSLLEDQEDLMKELAESSSLLPDKEDLKKKLGKRHRSKDSPKNHDSDSPQTAPVESPLPPLKPPPSSKVLAPLPSPPLPSPPPPPPPQSSPPPQPPSPPPPSPPPPQSHFPPSSPPPSPVNNHHSSIAPLNFNQHKYSSPPTPPENSSSSSSSSHNAPSNVSNHQGVHGGGSHAKSTGENSGKYVGYTLAGVVIVAFVAVVVVLTFRRKKTRPDVHVAYMHNFHLKPGADGHYFMQQPGPQLSLGRNYGSGNNIGGSMNHLGASLDPSQPKSGQIAFSYDMVMEMTNAFSSEYIIGQGGFGYVYKGVLPDGKAVAVKQLRAGSGQGDREFTAEVQIISRVHHRHLVSLVGYCISEQQRVLIYEYVPNGTLHHHLHGSDMPVLDWDKRLKIAIGAAKGLAYLHEDCSQKIIHRDIKSANILLDDAFEAQVADFGLARLADAANTHVSTRVMGTFGYMAPEYATSGKLTDRSDVFSFGVVLLELITGRKPVDESQPLGDESLVEWARPLLLRSFETREFRELIDPRLENHYVEGEMFRMIEAAAACIRHCAPRRPRMAQVVRALDSGDEAFDLSNGVKYGQSTVYDSGQYDRDIMLFRRMTNGSYGDSDFDKMYSRESSLSRDTNRYQHVWMPSSSSSSRSESSAFNKHKKNSAE